MDDPTVELADADFTFFWGCDLGAFVSAGDDLLRLARANTLWLDDLHDALHRCAPTKTLNAHRAEIDQSRFELTNERVGASTLAALRARKQMPLRVFAMHDDWQEGGPAFDWRVHSVSIGALGAVAVRYEARLRSQQSVEAVIDGYHTTIQLLRADVIGVLGELLGLLSLAAGPLKDVSFKKPSLSELETFLVAYECLDIELARDGRDETEGSTPIKTLIASGDTVYIRQLAALSRMTPTEPDHYDPQRLQSFQAADIGNRVDELWIVNSNRMVRAHPERRETRIQLFYEDVLCLTELLVQQLAGLEYMEHWLVEARNDLRRRVSGYGGQGSLERAGGVLASIEATTDLIAHPRSLIVGVRHPFFRGVAERLIAELRLEELGVQLSQSTSLLLSVAGALFSYDTSVASHELSVQTAKATTTVRRLSWVIALATIAAVAIAIAALLWPRSAHAMTSRHQLAGSHQVPRLSQHA